MATITTIASGDLISSSRTDINTNFENLNADKIETTTLDTDTSLAANSDSKIATQKAVKAYADAVITQNASETVKGAVEEATDAEVTAGTATGGTGAKLFVTPAKLATLIALYQPLNVYASGVTTRNNTDANGNQTIAHGLGKIPKRVTFNMQFAENDDHSISYGTYDGTTNYCVFSAAIATARIDGTGNTFAIRAYEDTTAKYNTGVVTFDATNITIAWTKTSTPAGTSNIFWEAFA